VAGKLFVVSGPSGAGKGTLLKGVLAELDAIHLAVSATTRQPRKGERDGIEYFFLSDEQFDSLIDQQGMLEWASVHGARYGTPKAEVLAQLNAGFDIILEIDPQGAAQVRLQYPAAVLIFIEPPSLEELARRLRDRGTESEAAIALRLSNAMAELSVKGDYDKVIVNDDLDQALGELIEFIKATRTR